MKQLFNYLLIFFLIIPAENLSAQPYSKAVLSTIKTSNSSSKFVSNFSSSSPLLLKDVESNIFSTHFAPKPFNLDLNTISVAFALNLDTNVKISTALFGIGNSNFFNITYDAAMGFQLKDMFVAAKLTYSIFSAEGFGNYNDVQLGIAVNYKIGPSLYAATFIDRIELYNEDISEGSQYIESISGFSYLIDEFTSVEVDYHLLSNLFSSFSFGFKHFFSSDIGLSFAYQTVVKEIDICSLVSINRSFQLLLNYNYQTELGHKKILTLSYLW